MDPSPAQPIATRLDAHVHSKASDKPVMAAAGFLGCPECYSEPEQIYDMARARGMDLVAITDHDQVWGAQQLVDRGFPGVLVGEEVTVFFPEDHCKLHVLVWDLTPDLHEQIGKLGLRDDVYKFAGWLNDRDLPHALAHPLYIQNGRLTRWHVERCALLFRAFEQLNGAHQGAAKDVIGRFLKTLDEAKCEKLAAEHELEPVWSEPWKKGTTAGSDDHALLNIGRTYTQIVSDKKIADASVFIRRAVGGESTAEGVGGHSSLLAHQITTVAANCYARELHPRATPTGKIVGRKLLKFAGLDAEKPKKRKVAAHVLRKHVVKRAIRKRGRPQPLLQVLRANIGPVLRRHPDLVEALNPDTWAAQGPALARHDEMAEFFDELVSAVQEALASKAGRAWRNRDRQGLTDVIAAYALVQLAQAPYIFSLFHQNKERAFLERLDHELSIEDGGKSVLERPMRVSLFTDTLGDVNGVCRFIQNVAERARETGRNLEVITCTRLPVPDAPNIHNFKPVFAGSMPKYPNLEAVLPPITAMLRHLDEHQPDVLHISTPGPVGFVGYIAARMLKIPVLGVYHTDFPAYIDHLFDDHALTVLCSKYMSFFYKPFWKIFTRSEDYVDSLEKLGMSRDRCCALLPGCDTELFNVRHKDRGIWKTLGLDPDKPKALYVGRVSVEKNLPMLTAVWKRTHAELKQRGVDADLVIVGDGPYREQMQRELAACNAQFLGFKHGHELSTIYASADLFAFPSVTDTLGQVVMESQASGIPVIVTDKGGPKEVVEHGKTGFVLDDADTGAWVSTLVNLLSDESKRSSMGAAGHEYVQQFSLANSFEHFWSVHTDAWHAHLERLGIDRSERQTSEAAAGA